MTTALSSDLRAAPTNGNNGLATGDDVRGPCTPKEGLP